MILIIPITSIHLFFFPVEGLCGAVVCLSDLRGLRTVGVVGKPSDAKFKFDQLAFMLMHLEFLL